MAPAGAQEAPPPMASSAVTVPTTDTSVVSAAPATTTNASTTTLWFGRRKGEFAKVNDQVGAGQDYRPILSDISGGFRAEVFWYGPGATEDTVCRGRSSSSPYFAKESTNLGVTGNYQPFTADLNGDGTEDVYWYAPGVAADTLWKMNLSGWIPQA
ncbi:MAG TPA: hypothetical protein PKA98_05940 [Acidimicrobiales bacterium]|nr:hypothetical protein [Acidimicrobiales bacterium]